MVPYIDLFDSALHRFVEGASYRFVRRCLTWICLRVPYIDLFHGALYRID